MSEGKVDNYKDLVKLAFYKDDEGNIHYSWKSAFSLQDIVRFDKKFLEELKEEVGGAGDNW